MKERGTKNNRSIFGLAVFALFSSAFAFSSSQVRAETTQYSTSLEQSCVSLCEIVKDAVGGYKDFFNIFSSTRTDGFLEPVSITVVSFDYAYASSTARQMHLLLPQLSCFVNMSCSSRSEEVYPLRITALKCFETAQRLCFNKISQNDVAVLNSAEHKDFFQILNISGNALRDTVIIMEVSQDLNAVEDVPNNVLFASSDSSLCQESYKHCYVLPGSVQSLALIVGQLRSLWPSHRKNEILTLISGCGATNSLDFSCFLGEEGELSLELSRETLFTPLIPSLTLAGNAFAPWRERSDFGDCPVALSLCGGIQTFFRNKDVDSTFNQILIDLTATEVLAIKFSTSAAATLATAIAIPILAPIILPLHFSFLAAALTSWALLASAILPFETDTVATHDISISGRYLLEEGSVAGYAKAMRAVLENMYDDSAHSVNFRVLNKDGVPPTSVQVALGGFKDKQLWCLVEVTCSDNRVSPVRIQVNACAEQTVNLDDDGEEIAPSSRENLAYAALSLVCVTQSFRGEPEVLQVSHSVDFINKYLKDLSYLSLNTVLVLAAAEYDTLSEKSIFVQNAVDTGQVIFVSGGGKITDDASIFTDASNTYKKEHPDLLHSRDTECVAQRYGATLAGADDVYACMVNNDVSPLRETISSIVNEDGVTEELVVYQYNAYEAGPEGEEKEIVLPPELARKLTNIGLSIDKFSPEIIALIKRVPDNRQDELTAQIPDGGITVTDALLPIIEAEIKKKLLSGELLPEPIKSSPCDASLGMEEACVSAPSRLVAYTEENIYVDSQTEWDGGLDYTVYYSAHVDIVSSGIALIRILWPTMVAQDVVSTVFECATLDESKTQEEKAFVGRGIFSMDCPAFSFSDTQDTPSSVPSSLNDWKNLHAYNNCPIASSTCEDLIVRIAHSDDETQIFSLTFEGVDGFAQFAQSYQITQASGALDAHNVNVFSTSRTGLEKLKTFFRVGDSTGFACLSGVRGCSFPITVGRDDCLTTCGSTDTRNIRVLYVDDIDADLSVLLEKKGLENTLFVLPDEDLIENPDWLSTDRILIGVGSVKYREQILRQKLNWQQTVSASDLCATLPQDEIESEEITCDTVSLSLSEALGEQDAFDCSLTKNLDLGYVQTVFDVCEKVTQTLEKALEDKALAGQGTSDCSGLEIDDLVIFALCESIAERISKDNPNPLSVFLPMSERPTCTIGGGYCALFPEIVAQYENDNDELAVLTRGMAAPTLAGIAGMFFSLWPDVETPVMVSLIKDNCFSYPVDGVSDFSLTCVLKERGALGWNISIAQHNSISSSGYTLPSCQRLGSLCVLESGSDAETYVPGLQHLLKGAQVAWYTNKITSASLLSIGGDAERISPFLGYACLINQDPDCSAIVKITNKETVSNDDIIDNFTTIRISDPDLLSNLSAILPEKSLLILGANYGKVAYQVDRVEDVNTPVTPIDPNVLGPNEVWADPPTNPANYDYALRTLILLSIEYNVSIGSIAPEKLTKLGWLDWSLFLDSELEDIGIALATLTKENLLLILGKLDGFSEADLRGVDPNVIANTLIGEVYKIEQDVVVRVRVEEDTGGNIVDTTGTVGSSYDSLSALYDDYDTWKTQNNTLFVTPNGTSCGEEIKERCISAPDVLAENGLTFRGISSYVVAFSDAIVTSLWPELSVRERIVLYENCALPFPEGDERTGLGIFSLECITKDPNTVAINSSDLVDQSPTEEANPGQETGQGETSQGTASAQTKPSAPPVTAQNLASLKNYATDTMTEFSGSESAASFVTGGLTQRKPMRVVFSSPQTSLSYVVMSAEKKAFHGLRFQNAQPWGELAFLSGVHVEQEGFGGAHFYDPMYRKRISGVTNFFHKNYHNMIKDVQETMSGLVSLFYNTPSLNGFRLRLATTFSFSKMRPSSYHIIQNSQGIEGVFVAIIEQKISPKHAFAHTTISAEGNCHTGIYGTFQVANQIFNMTTTPQCSTSLRLNMAF